MAKTVSIQGEAPSAQTRGRDVDLQRVEFSVDPDGPANVPPRLPANSMFLYAVHPARWTVIDGRVVPQLATIQLTPGVNECELTRNGRVRWRKAVQNWQERGWTVVKPDWAPDGQGYQQRVAVRGGFHYCDVFTQPHAGTDAVTSNLKGLADWLEQLIDEGHILPPEPWALRSLLERAQRDALARPENLAPVLKAVRAKLDEVSETEAERFAPAETEQVGGLLDEDDDDAPAKGRRSTRTSKQTITKE